MHSTDFWDKPCGMEELLAAQEECSALDAAQQSERQDRQQSLDQKSTEAIQKEKTLFEDLVVEVINDNGRWCFTSREGRTGAKLTRDHLEAVFIATAQKVPASKLDNLLPLAQAACHWNAEPL